MLPTPAAAQAGANQAPATIPAEATSAVTVAEVTSLRTTAAVLEPAEGLPPAGTEASGENNSGQLRTAAQVESEGARHDAEASQQALPKSGNSLVPAIPVGQMPPEQAKYDVRLIGQRNVGNGLNFYSLDREMALGRELSKEVEATSKVLQDPVVSEYVNRIGQNIVRNSDARVPFTIKVLDNDEVNAFALPGGFFYVDTGLILAADNEAELAGVMAHEIAHVAARHATKNMTKSQIWNMASIPLIFIGGPAGYAIAEVASIAVPMSFLKFSRDAEREADVLGLEYDYATGYDPQAFVQFFEKLKMDEKTKHRKLANLFSTHPMNSDRIDAAQDEIRKYLPDRDSYVVDTSEFYAVKQRLLAMDGNQLNLKSPNRPVLLKRTGNSTDADSDATSGTPPPSQPDPKDDGHPTLKRTNAPSD